MQFEQEVLSGAWVVRLKRFADVRGTFVKTYARSVFDAHAAGRFETAEEFYSLSNRDVIRGMHFQRPPHDHAKLVYCASGAVDDVLLDLRRGPGYGRVVRIALDAETPTLVVIPSGIAHGFRSLADASLMVYKTSTEHVPSHDAGIRWNSFGFDWGCNAPVLSERDRAHPPLVSFASPFV